MNVWTGATTIKKNLQHVWISQGTLLEPRTILQCTSKPAMCALSWNMIDSPCTLSSADGWSYGRMEQSTRTATEKRKAQPQCSPPLSFFPLACTSWEWFVVQATTVTQTRSPASSQGCLLSIGSHVVGDGTKECQGATVPLESPRIPDPSSRVSNLIRHVRSVWDVMSLLGLDEWG